MPEDWDVFEKNAHRVHSFVLNKRRRDVPLSRKALYEISHSRRSIEIFPSLKSLTGRTSELNALFMTRTVDRLHLLFDSNTYTDEDDFTILFARISAYMPDVEFLSLEGPSIETRQDHALSILVMQLRSLKKVVLPSQFVPEFTFESLAFCPKLEDVLVYHTHHSGINVHGEDVIPSLRADTVHFAAHGFKHLRVLSLCFLSIESAIVSMLSSHFPSETVVHLRLYFAYFSSEIADSSFESLTAAISTQCPRLLELYIGFVSLRFMHGYARVAEPRHLEFRDISAFFDLPSLSSFTLDYPKAVEMEESAVDYIIRMGTRLRHLSISPWPEYPFDYNILPLSSLSRLARHCPNIRTLALCVDASLPSIHSSQVSVMRHLQTLTLGRSPLSFPRHESPSSEHWSSVARFLAAFMPLRSSLVVQDGFRERISSTVDSAEDTSGDDEVTHCEGGWNLVTAAVRVMQQVDEEHVEEMHRLRNEIRGLEAAILDLHT